MATLRQRPFGGRRTHAWARSRRGHTRHGARAFCIGESRRLVARGIETSLVAARLRACLDELRIARSTDASMLEQLHQDLVQIHTVACIGVELSSLMSSAEGEADALHESLDAYARFERLALTWLTLASAHETRDRVLAADELLRDIVELMRVEASMMRVVVSLDGVRVGASASAFEALKVFKRTAAAMRVAGEGGRVEVALSPEGVVSWTIVPMTGPSAVVCATLKGAP